MKKLPLNSATKDILTLVSGNAVAFIIPVLLYPILSRIFTPPDYALYGLYVAVFGFLEISSAGRYDFGVIMPEHDDDAINIVGGGLVISVVFSLLILLLVFFLKESFSAILNNNQLANWLYVLPAALFLVSVSKLFNAWLIRIKKFKAASVNKASQKLGEGVTQTVFGQLKLGNGLILGDLAGRLFNAIFSLYQSEKSGFDFGKLSRKKVMQNLQRYIELPKFGILPSMLNTLGGMLPTFLISAYYSVDATGHYNFSRIILSVPFALISTGISQVLMQQVSERRFKNQRIYNDMLSVAIKLIGLSVIGILVLFFLGPQLFEILFGEKWSQAGEYTSILIFSYAVSFVVSPFSMLLVVLGKIKMVSVWQTFYFIAVSFLWLVTDLTITNFLIVLVIIDVVAYTVYGIIIYKVIWWYERNLLQ